ncbi:hypothetical protein [Pseudohaliea sp.]|uniref:thiolase C-terminal domain-containing protein n=1 Tax=Pseudohaliea sp. TaxID=2740289 RepID=UPI0032EEB3A5
MDRSLRGRTAIVGVGQTPFYRHGQSPDAETQLTLKAILAACRDAGISPADIDGFSSFSDDRSNGARLASTLGCRELRYSNMVWGGGGGGVAAALANASAAVATGLAECVVVYRGLAQGQFGRLGRGPAKQEVRGESAHTAPYGLMAGAQLFAMKMTRFMKLHDIQHSAMRAVALASYRHAQNNPSAMMYGKPLTEEKYDAARWIVEPFRLYDCCQENDGAGALIVTAAERAKDFPHPPCFLLGAASGAPHRGAARVHNSPDYGGANFSTVAPRLYAMAGVSAADIDVLQCYEHFTGGVVVAMIEHGFCTAEEANDFFTLENFTAPDGRLPLNTSGGNLAEGYTHGISQLVEAVQQIRGASTNQVPGAEISMMVSGSWATPVSNCILGAETTL